MFDNIDGLLKKFTDLEEEFNYFFSNGDGNKDSFIEYERRFVELKASVRPIKALVTRMAAKYDDKSATAIKFRIAHAIMRGEFVDKDDIIFDSCSISAAEKFASSTKTYKEFIDNRAIYKEALSNISDLRSDIDSYINLIKDRIK